MIKYAKKDHTGDHQVGNLRVNGNIVVFVGLAITVGNC